MKKSVKILSVVFALVLIVSCFAACGGDKADTLRVGVQTNTTGHLYTAWDFGEDVPVAYDNGAVAVEALKNGKVDCVIIDNEPAKSFVAANEGIHILEGENEYAVEDYAICVKKGNTELLNKINEALEELKADGTIDKIIEKYIPSK